MAAEWDPVTTWQPIVRDELESSCPVYAPVIDKCPVAHVDDVYGGFWGVFGYDELVEAALDTRTFSNEVPLSAVPGPPLESDPPEHTGYRLMLNRFFLPGEMTELEPTVRAFTTEMIDQLLARGSADFAVEFA